jgi:hypothetical protein
MFAIFFYLELRFLHQIMTGILFIAFLISLLVSAAALSKVQLKAGANGDKIFIEASTGRQMLFHGVNTIVKGFPYVPLADEWDIDVSLSEKDHAALADLGKRKLLLQQNIDKNI